MISEGCHGHSEIALPNLSERESKKNQFGEDGLGAYLGRYNVNIAKTSFSFLIDKLGDKLVLETTFFFGCSLSGSILVPC